MLNNSSQPINFNSQEKYIIGKSLNDMWGYPYRPKVIKFLFSRDEYKEVDDRLIKTDYHLEIEDFPIILNALDMLYYENEDFVALYDDVTKEDVKVLFDKLEKFYNDHKVN